MDAPAFLAALASAVAAGGGRAQIARVAIQPPQGEQNHDVEEGLVMVT